MKQFVKAESVELLQSGNDFFESIIRIIDAASESIHLQTFILNADETGKQVADHLIKAAHRGVNIFLLLDGYGSRDLPIDFVHKLRSAGIQVRFFATFFSSESISLVRRIHHKILVVDEHISVIGGINIGNKYHGGNGIIPWLDFAVVVKGGCNRFVHQLCESFYRKKKFKLNRVPSSGAIPVRFRRNDWFRRKNEIFRSYKEGVATANESIVIVASYFLPGYFFLRQLKMASKRGVKVKVLIGGVSDITWFHYAEKYLYSFLLRNGIEIFEWTDSVMHGKVAVFDAKWCTIGSYNLNNLSKYQCVELNVDVNDPIFSLKISDKLETIMHEKCREITEEELLKQRTFFQLVKSLFAYYLYKLMMYLIVPKE